MEITKSNHQDARGDSPGSFAAYSLTFHNLGIPTVPCGKHDGKRPLIKWTQFQSYLPTRAQLQLWAAQFPEANIGIITGKLSNLTVLDCDDPNISLEELERKFSPSRFVVRSPRGGLHAYYSHSNEGNSQGLYPSIDIRGQGGLIIGPFSIKREENARYEIIKGTFSDLKCLSPIQNLGSYQNTKNEKSNILKKGERVETGNRNNTPFLAVKEAAFTAQSYNDLQTFAYKLNQEAMELPLPIHEVLATVNQVWQYKLQSRLIPKGTSFYHLSTNELEDLSNEPNALVLYQLLKKKHANIRKEFFIAQDKVAQLLGWNDRRCVSKAIQVLLTRKKITLIKRGNGQGSPHIYAFC